jgi:NADH-quinone oxidoreductase subunit F
MFSLCDLRDLCGKSDKEVLPMEKMLLKRVDIPNATDIDVALKHGAYSTLADAFGMRPVDVVNEVKRANLRGRGGAGFPTGLKWELCSRVPGSLKYLLCNADEGEPGTFKDRFILLQDPHLLIEGMVISGYAIGAERGYIYLRYEYPTAYGVLEKAIEQAYAKGYLGKNILGKGANFDLSVHRGAGAYICGEETALIESLEGKRGQPRIRPPFPASQGAWRKPTVINNVETLSNIPYLIKMGADAYAKIGAETSPGPKLYGVSGMVNKPGVYELPMGVTLRDIIYTHCGGVKGGKKIKAIIPGGASTPMLTEQHLDVKMDYNSLVAVGTMLGSGAVMVMDETVNMVQATYTLVRFFAHESCGKCTPCREGTAWLYQVYKRLMHGEGKPDDIDLLLYICDTVKGKCFCPLGEGAIQPVLSSIKHFRGDYEEWIKSGKSAH